MILQSKAKENMYKENMYENKYKYKNKYEKASLSIESAIVIPLFCLFSIFLFYILQAQGAYTKINRALCKTAETMSAYASLYHYHGVENVEDTLLSKLKNLEAHSEEYSESDSENENEKLLKQFINLKNVAKKGDDILYDVLALKLYEYYYEKEEYFTNEIFESENVSFAGSEFFNDGNIIELKVTANVKSVIALPFDFTNKIKISCTQRVKCMLYGKINSQAIVNLNVWDMDKLSRGKYFRSIYGANLSEYYPVISIYDGNTATMIKSIDHTAESYKNGENLKKIITEYVNKLAEFDGTDNSKYKNYTPKIASGEIKEKVLLLIFPTNEMTEEQIKAVAECVSLAGGKNIKVKTEMYGKS